MVGRAETAWVLITTLLLCPFACLGQAVASFTSTEVGCGATDTCCAPSGSPADDRGPGDREGGERGGNCLCHGAVMADHSSDWELQPVAVFWVLAALPTTVGPALSADDASAEEHACHFANVDSGREVRALIESFLF